MLLALLLPLLGSANDVESDPVLVVRRYDLSGVLPRLAASHGVEVLFPHIRVDGSDHLPGIEPRDPPHADSLLALVQDAAGDEFDLEGRWLNLVEGPELVVRAPEATQKHVLEQLQVVETMFAGGGELLVDILRFSTTPPPASAAVLTQPEVDKLLATTGTARSTQRIEFRPRETVGVDLTGSTAFVVDYNVEIAQAAAVWDPVVASIRPGTRLQASCSPAPGGTWIALSLRATDPIGGTRDVPVALHGQITTQDQLVRTGAPRTMQSVVLENRSMALNAFLGDGKALFLRTGLELDGHRSNVGILVRVAARPGAREHRLVAPFKEGGGEVRAYPLGFSAPTLVDAETHGLLAGGLSPISIYEPDHHSLQVQFLPPNVDPLFDLVRNEQVDVEVGDWGEWMIVRAADRSRDAPAPNFEAVSAALARACPSPRTFQLDFTLRQAGPNGRALASSTLVARAGAPAFAVLGREETRVYDYDVEVAQSCSVADPHVEIAFEGLALRATPLTGLSGELRLELLCRGRIQRAPAREFDGGNSALGSIVAAEYDEVRCADRLTIGKEGARMVRLGDTGNAPNGLVLEVQMTEVR